MRSMMVAAVAGQLGVLALLASGTARADSFDYKIRHYPPGDNTDCNELAISLGHDFAQATGVVVTRAICNVSNDFGYSMQITYTAAAELNLVTTEPRMGGIDGGGGVFASADDCNAAMPDEVARFKNATGLSPIVSYCDIDVFADDENEYAIHIDAFGEPIAGPMLDVALLFGQPIGITTDDLVSSVRSGLVAAGLDLQYVRYREGAGDSSLVVQYYAKDRQNFDAQNVADEASESDCTLAAHEAAAIYAVQPGSGALLSLCLYDAVLDSYSVKSLTVGDHALNVSPSVEEFASFGSCQSAQAEVVRHYRDDLHRPVVGGVCGRTRFDSDWRVMIFENL